METRLSTKGRVILPAPLRHELGIQSGDILDVTLEGDRIFLTPREKRIAEKGKDEVHLARDLTRDKF